MRKHEIILHEIPKTLGRAFTILSKFSDDFFAGGRHNTQPQPRDYSRKDAKDKDLKDTKDLRDKRT